MFFRKLTPFILVVASFGALVSACSSKNTNTTHVANQRISHQIKAFTEKPEFEEALWGVSVVDLSTGDFFCQINEKKLFVPASVVKLVTAGLALDTLGEDFTTKTSVYSSSSIDEKGTVADLILYGRGDPLLQIKKKDANNSLEALVDALVEQGVKHVQGDLVADVSYFKAPYWGKGWEWDDRMYYYGTGFCALNVNRNRVAAVLEPASRVGDYAKAYIEPENDYVKAQSFVTTQVASQEKDVSYYYPLSGNLITFNGVIGQQTPLSFQRKAKPNQLLIGLRDPAEFTLKLFEKILKEKGITIGGKVRVVRSQETSLPANELTFVESQPLKIVLNELLHDSTYNAGIEAVALQIGASKGVVVSDNQVRKRTDRQVSDIGIKLFESMGIDPSTMYLVDASGLSRQDNVSPEALGMYLKAVYGKSYYTSFKEALPVAGQSGFLKKRLLDPSTKGHCFAKTGSMTGISALAGYMTTVDGRELAITILLNNYHNSRQMISATDAVDAIATIIAKEGKS